MAGTSQSFMSARAEERALVRGMIAGEGAAFERFSDTIRAYGGTPRELRGDALLATFGRASDAVSASLAFQGYAPALLKMAGGRQSSPVLVSARTTDVLKKRPGRVEYQRGILSRDEHGELLQSIRAFGDAAESRRRIEFR